MLLPLCLIYQGSHQETQVKNQYHNLIPSDKGSEMLDDMPKSYPPLLLPSILKSAKSSFHSSKYIAFKTNLIISTYKNVELGRWLPLRFLPLKCVFRDLYNSNPSFKSHSEFSSRESPSDLDHRLSITGFPLHTCGRFLFLSSSSVILVCHKPQSPSHINHHRSLALKNP